MNNKQFMTLAFGIALICVLCGCASHPVIDEFAATWPDVVEPVPANNGSIYQVGQDVQLFENSVAHRVGDTVTINLVESTAAQKSSSTKTAKTSNIDMSAPTIAGGGVKIGGRDLFSVGIDNSRKFDGSGDSQLSNKLEGFVTVTVAKRLPNGNLLVRGQKWISINQGSEFIRVQGVIRPIDILPDNSIASYKVADATISYGGRGALADANRPGLLSRFFNSKWNPF